MRLIQRQVVSEKVFRNAYGNVYPVTELLERLASVCGYSYPFPKDIHCYYFLMDNCKQMMVEIYKVEVE